MKAALRLASAISALALATLPLTAREAAATSFSDSFDDGVINTALWTTHGYQIGQDTWQYSFTEETPGGGYLNARVWGSPVNMYDGAEAWVMTTQDFNTGDPWLVNFTWGTAFGVAPPDCEGAVSISVVQTFLPVDDPLGPGWVGSDCRAYFHQLWHDWYGGGDTPDRPFDNEQWSIVFDPSGTATLYQLPDGQGTAYRTVALDMSGPWYLGFFLPNYTDFYAEGDSSFQLYDFSATTIPEPSVLAVAGLALLIVIRRAGRSRIGR